VSTEHEHRARQPALLVQAESSEKEKAECVEMTLAAAHRGHCAEEAQHMVWRNPRRA
jgi:hypothetical protein